MRQYFAAIFAVLCFAIPAQAEMLCTPVNMLAAKFSQTGKVLIIEGNESGLAYAKALGPIPKIIERVEGVLVYDTGGPYVASGLIESVNETKCVRLSIIISRDKHLSAMDAMRGI